MYCIYSCVFIYAYSGIICLDMHLPTNAAPLVCHCSLECVYIHMDNMHLYVKMFAHTHIFTYVIIARLVRAQCHGYKDQKVLPAQHKFQHFLQCIKAAETLLFLLPSETGAQHWPSASSCLWLQHPCSPTLTTNRNRQYSKAVTFRYFISLYCYLSLIHI